MKEFHKLINQLIALNHKNRENLPESTIKALPVGSFNQEYCTVKIDIGRATGKSEYIRANSDEKTLIVVRKIIHKEEYRESKALVLTPLEIFHGLHRGRAPFERIYFDEPTFLFANRREYNQTYEFLSVPLVKQTFIHIGC